MLPAACERRCEWYHGALRTGAGPPPARAVCSKALTLRVPQINNDRSIRAVAVLRRPETTAECDWEARARALPGTRCGYRSGASAGLWANLKCQVRWYGADVALAHVLSTPCQPRPPAPRPCFCSHQKGVDPPACPTCKSCGCCSVPSKRGRRWRGQRVAAAVGHSAQPSPPTGQKQLF